MLSIFDEESRQDRVIVALDCAADKAIAISYLLAGQAKWVKIGMTLYYAYGTDLVKILKERGYKVFLDLKFYDIPHQVEGAARSAAESGADMITMHTSGGIDMMKAAFLGAAEGAQKIGANAPVTLGITMLTSMNDQTLEDIGVCRPMQEQVLSLAHLSEVAGISGVVASPQEAEVLRAAMGESAYIVCPGVRPLGSAVGDQSRVATPKAAFDSGASHIVIGRPITDAADPVSAFCNIVEELD